MTGMKQTFRLHTPKSGFSRLQGGASNSPGRTSRLGNRMNRAIPTFCLASGVFEWGAESVRGPCQMVGKGRYYVRV